MLVEQPEPAFDHRACASEKGAVEPPGRRHRPDAGGVSGRVPPMASRARCASLSRDLVLAGLPAARLVEGARLWGHYRLARRALVAPRARVASRAAGRDGPYRFFLRHPELHRGHGRTGCQSPTAGGACHRVRFALVTFAWLRHGGSPARARARPAMTNQHLRHGVRHCRGRTEVLPHIVSVTPVAQNFSLVLTVILTWVDTACLRSAGRCSPAGGGGRFHRRRPAWLRWRWAGAGSPSARTDPPRR